MGQRQWTIECRADYADTGKNEAVTQAIRDAAIHLHALLRLIDDQSTAQVVCFSEDFFSGYQEIALHAAKNDKLGSAVKEYGDKYDTTEISDEMLAALRGK